MAPRLKYIVAYKIIRFRWNKFGKNMKPQWDGGGAKVDFKWCVHGTPMDCKWGVIATNLGHTWGSSLNFMYKCRPTTKPKWIQSVAFGWC
jgi:hypothetical protein